MARVGPEPAAPAEAPAADVAQPSPARTAPPVEPSPVQEPAPTVSPWTKYMDEVGIAAADQPIILEMLFTAYDWDLRDCRCDGPARRLVSNQSRFHYLDSYVKRTHGSWAAAKAQAAQGAW